MTKEELVKLIKDEVSKNGEIHFAVELYDGYDNIVQNGTFTEDYIIRDVCGMEHKETYEEIDEDVLNNCYESRVTFETLFNNARLNTRNDHFLMVSLLNQVLEAKIGEDSADLNLAEYGNHYDCVYWQDYQYCVSLRYYGEDGTEYTTSEPISNLSIDMLNTIFHKINK